MPLYFFDAVADVRLTDSDGTMLADSESALAHGLQVIRELMFKRTEMLGQPWSAWTMHVNDKDGKASTELNSETFPKVKVSTKLPRSATLRQQKPRRR